MEARRELARSPSFPVIWIVLSVLGSLFAPTTAYAEKRVALVIGNSTYAHASALRNPANDARAIAELLKWVGFEEITLKLDLGFDGMRLALRDFGLKTHGAEVALVYFAGHGLEIGGENYLVPVDASLKTASSVAFEAATLSAVLDAIRPAGKLRLVILDACRTNPLAARMQVAGGLTRSVPRGLGRIEPTGDVLVAYAAKAGTVAEDGKGRHSPYSEALLTHLATPGLDIRLVMGRVRDVVLTKTAGVQEPFVYGSLGGTNVSLVSVIAVEDNGRNKEDVVARKYGLTSRIGTKEAWDAFIAAHPSGFYAELARANVARLSAPTSAKPTSSPLLQKDQAKPDVKGNTGLDIARLKACCIANCKRSGCTDDSLCRNDSYWRSTVKTRSGYNNLMLAVGCGAPSEQANFEKRSCAQMRQVIASGRVHPQSDYANYARSKCGAF